MRAILTQAAEVGRAVAKTLARQARIPKDVLYAYPGKRKWKHIFLGDPAFHTPNYMAINQRSKYAFEAIGSAKFMLYGPEKPYFEKTWIPGDAEKVN